VRVSVLLALPSRNCDHLSTLVIGRPWPLSTRIQREFPLKTLMLLPWLISSCRTRVRLHKRSGSVHPGVFFGIAVSLTILIICTVAYCTNKGSGKRREVEEELRGYLPTRGHLVAPLSLNDVHQFLGVRDRNAVCGSQGRRRSEDSLGTAVTGGSTAQTRNPLDDDAPPPYEPRIERRQTM
jgi:hypothetical protein